MLSLIVRLDESFFLFYSDDSLYLKFIRFIVSIVYVF